MPFIPHYHHDRIDSTQAEAERLIRDGVQTRTFLVSADQQSAGRGSRGRCWISRTGNLYASLALVLPTEIKTPQLTPYAAALGVYDMLVPDLVAGPHVTLKWPNDILIDEKKVAGILITGQQTHSVHWLIIGVGLNLRHHPDDTVYPATHLARHISDVPEPDTAAALLADRIWSRIDQWAITGDDALIKAYLAHAYKLGQTIGVLERGATSPTVGRYNGIDRSGALNLSTVTGQALIYAGDIFPALE